MLENVRASIASAMDGRKMNPVEILKQLIEFPTYQVSPDKVEEGMKDCASFLSANLENLGFTVKTDELFNITAEKGYGGEKSFLINTHYDTVPPSFDWKDALTPLLKDKKLFGLGASDAKGGIAATLAALSRLDKCRFSRLIVQFVNYEDNAINYGGKRWLGAPYFLSNNPNFMVDYGLNVEPTVVDDKWTVSIGCTGRVSFTIKTVGKEAHSSTPRLGRNAIYDMFTVVEALGRISPGKFRLNGFEAEMPVNVAMIEGGRAMNIVPGECRITCERRIFPGESPQEIMETVRSTLQNLKHIKIEWDFNPNVQLPYMVERNEEAVSLVLNSFQEKLGFKPDLRIELGRTDSTYLYHVGGIKTVITGPGHMGHAPNEYVNTDRLLEFTEVLLAILEENKRRSRA